jgi:hypothetical protein
MTISKETNGVIFAAILYYKTAGFYSEVQRFEA